MNPAAGATVTLLIDNAGAGPARHADRVEQTAGTSNAPSGGPRLLKIPLLRPAAVKRAKEWIRYVVGYAHIDGGHIMPTAIREDGVLHALGTNLIITKLRRRILQPLRAV